MKILCLLFFIPLFFSCQVKSREIDFGNDACNYCKMTIVDSRHAAQMVAETGKVFNYDAIECMMNEMVEWNGPTPKLFYVSDYPGAKLIDATVAEYLICDSIPSPMGAFLSAFENDEVLHQLKDAKGGQKLTWQELSKEYEVLNISYKSSNGHSNSH